MKFELIPATAHHRVYLLELRKLTMVEHLEQVGIFLTDEEHLARVDHHYDCFYLIVCDDQMAGALKYIVDKQQIEVLQLQIHPQYQGKGLGKRVINQMIALAQMNDRSLVLKVLKANPAKQLYQRLGFVVIGQDELEFHMRWRSPQQSTTQFYDDFSTYYHLIFDDWEATIAQQANIIGDVVRKELSDSHQTILDVSCGIGTQAIGLALAGFDLTASDLSAGQITKARIEAQKRGANISFSVGDMRTVDQQQQRTFDVVICCDNSVPHLLSDEEITIALRSFYHCLKPGGGCIITLRDYDKENRDGISLKPYGVRMVDGVRYTLLQSWEFIGDHYILSMYCIAEVGDEVNTKIFRAQYYAIGVAKMLQLMTDSGFSEVRVVDCDYYQPLLIGIR